MITLKEFLETVNYRITEVDSTFAENVIHIDYWDGNHNGVAAFVSYNTKDQRVITATVCDYSRNRAYCLGDEEEYAWDDVKYIKLETDKDFLEKAKAIVNYQPYDERIEFQIELTESEELSLMRLAHQADMTVNDYIADVVLRYIREQEFVTGMFGDWIDGDPPLDSSIFDDDPWILQEGRNVTSAR